MLTHRYTLLLSRTFSLPDAIESRDGAQCLYTHTRSLFLTHTLSHNHPLPHANGSSKWYPMSFLSHTLSLVLSHTHSLRQMLGDLEIVPDISSFSHTNTSLQMLVNFELVPNVLSLFIQSLSLSLTYTLSLTDDRGSRDSARYLFFLSHQHIFADASGFRDSAPCLFSHTLSLSLTHTHILFLTDAGGS